MAESKSGGDGQKNGIQGDTTTGYATVYGRISPTLKTRWKEAVKKLKKKDNDVMVAMIRFFVDLPQPEQESICDNKAEALGNIESSVDDITKAIERTGLRGRGDILGRSFFQRKTMGGLSCRVSPGRGRCPESRGVAPHRVLQDGVQHDRDRHVTRGGGSRQSAEWWHADRALE